VLTHDVVADPCSRTIEIAMIAKLRTRFSQLRQQASLCCGGHAVSADQRRAIGLEWRVLAGCVMVVAAFELSLPVSTMSQWWVRRSSSAVVILGSPKTYSWAQDLEMPAISALSKPSGSVICGAWPNSGNSTSLAPGMALAAALPNSG